MGFFDEDEDELTSILLDPNLSQENREQAKRVQSLEKRISAAGLDPGDSMPRRSLFGDILDTLDAPRQGVVGVIDSALRGDIFSPEVGTGWSRGQDDDVTFSDVLRRHDLIDNPIARGIVGFGADILLDPLTYLTFGESAAARVGGKVLSEGGQALARQGVERLSKLGLVDTLDQSDVLDDVFKSIGRYQDSAKRIANSSLDSEKAIEAKRMADAEDVFSQLFRPEEVAGDLFEKPAVRIGVNLPFLGHLTEPSQTLAKETLEVDPGPIGQALRLAGQAFKPGRVKIADMEISDDLVNAFDNVRLFANEKLGKIVEQVDAAKTIPVLGQGVAAAEGAVKTTGNALRAANKAMRQIFNQKALTGEAFNNNRIDFLNVRAGNKIHAVDKTMNLLGEELADKDLMREVALTIDGFATSALKEQGVNNPDLLNTINRIRTAGDSTEADQLAFRAIANEAGQDGITTEQRFRGKFQQFLQDPSVPERQKLLVGKVIKGMDDLALEESQHGLGYSALEYYLPHRYKNIDQVANPKGGSKTPFFQQARKYETLSDAFEAKGYIGDTDLPSLLQFRFQRGLDAIADRRFFNRTVLEEGLPIDKVTELYKEAALDPKGAAAQALRRYKIDLKPLNPEDLKEGVVNKRYQEAVGKIGSGDLEADRIIASGIADLSDKVHKEMFENGFKPFDNILPDGLLGEIGEKVTHNGKEYILPQAIAKSLKETIGGKDILKQALGDSPIGKASLKVLDHGSSFFKKLVTLPFPAYWGQNFLGDRFNQAMAGVHAYDPGIFARTHSVLAGKSAITNVNGQKLSRESLERIIKDFGMSYSVNDFLGTVESFGNMNVDAFLAKKNGALANLFSSQKGSKVAALQQVHDKFQRSFDGFSRVAHLVHRFEKGDSIADAVRSANDLYFNYRDLSPVEQSLFRRFYMFYGYMSKATKQTMTNLVSNPGNITMQLHGSRALAEFFSDPNAAPTAEEHDARILKSVDQQEQLSRMIGKTKDGKPIFARGFAAPLNAVMQQFTAYTPRNFSVGELVDAGMDSARRTIQKQFATSNPAISAAAQVVSGKNLYFDKPLNAEFLRKLPDLTEGAQALAGYAHTDLPITINDSVKSFLKAVPDGKGRLIGDPARMWVLMNLVPGLGRATSMGGTLTNTDIPGPVKALRTLTGINIQDSDPSRNYLSTRRAELEKFATENSVGQRIKNLRDNLLEED